MRYELTIKLTEDEVMEALLDKLVSRIDVGEPFSRADWTLISLHPQGATIQLNVGERSQRLEYLPF